MASLAPTAFDREVAPEPRARTRPRPAPRRRVAGGVVWIVVLAVLLAGVVALSVSVLQLNLRLGKLGRERVQLRADVAELSSQLSSAAASARIQAIARTKYGLVPADPTAMTFLNLAQPAR
jgi:cell division protein FtsL